MAQTVTATEDFNPTGDVFGGAFSGTNWANGSWVRSGGNGNAFDVRAINPNTAELNIIGDLLQLDDNNAGAYRLIDLSGADSATLTFDYDTSQNMEGNETLLIQIDPENDGTYITLQTINATNNSPNPAQTDISVAIPIANLGGSNTRIRFITGASNGFNANGENWWIDNIRLTYSTATDTDGDGIDDFTDLDDDNDGIPDTEEIQNIIASGNFGTTVDLITLGGFEGTVQPTPGNNLGVAIAPWVLTNGGTNVVRVNGGTAYGNSGPRLDADPTTTAGTNQHYFDINGSGDLFQSFTLTTTRTIIYSGFFSPRDGNSGTASISILDGVGNTGTTLSTTGNVFISDNGGDTQNSPWTFAEGLVTLNPGTYSMVVVMSNSTNFDEAKAQAVIIDSDGDGINDTLDLDSDNDGIYDAVEAGHGQTHTNGVVNGAVGTDGIPNSVQTAANSGLINYTISDADSDGIFDVIELDADDDLCNDVAESGYTDNNGDGILGALPTVVDADGVVINTSVVDGYTTPRDNDENNIFDFQEDGPLTADAGTDLVLACGSTTVTLDGSGSSVSTLIPGNYGSNQNFNGTNGDDIVEINSITGGGQNFNLGNGDDILIISDAINGNFNVGGGGGDDTIVLALPASSYSINANQINFGGFTINFNGIENILFENNLPPVVSSFSYLWTTTDGTIDSGDTTLTPIVSSAGTYTLTVTDDVTGCTDTDTVIVSSPTLPTVTANATTTVICAGDSVTLTGGGANTYVWDNGVTDGVAFTPATTTTYTVTGTAANGCENTAQVTVTVNSVPLAPTVTSPVVYSLGETAVPLTATGTSLLWYTTATGGTGNPTAPTPSTASVGDTTFYVSQTNANGCESTRAAIVVTVQVRTVITNRRITYRVKKN